MDKRFAYYCLWAPDVICHFEGEICLNVFERRVLKTVFGVYEEDVREGWKLAG